MADQQGEFEYVVRGVVPGVGAADFACAAVLEASNVTCLPVAEVFLHEERQLSTIGRRAITNARVDGL